MEAGIDRGAKGFCSESASNRAACADSLRNCENVDLTEKKTNIIHSHLKRRKDESHGKERSDQWKAVCGKSARTV